VPQGAVFPEAAQIEFAVAVLPEIADVIAAAEGMRGLRDESLQFGFVLQKGQQIGRILDLPNGQTVRILLPAWTNIISMTEQALVAMDEIGDGLTRVRSAPRRRITRLLCGRNRANQAT